MKKIALLLITFVLLGFSVSYAAESHEVVYSDINVCINHYNIPSFAINGTSAVVLEDLSNYGIYVDSNSKPGTVRLSVKSGAKVNPVKFELDALQIGTVAGYATKNVVPVYINNTKIDSYYFNGYTFIPAESLNRLGEVYWLENERTLKIWLNGVALKKTYEPTPYNQASLVYKEVMHDLQIYIAAGNYDTALSALNWAIDTFGEDSPYYDSLSEKREEAAYLNAIKNINICINGNNLSNAVYEASSALEYAQWGSTYFKLLAEKYFELLYKDACNNVNIHLKNRDYYSAYITLYNTFSDMYDLAYEGFEMCDVYYEYTYNDIIAVCEAWKRYSGKSFIIADHWGYDGDITVVTINLENKPVKAFRFTANVCDVFGDAISRDYIDRVLYTTDAQLDAYSYDAYTWEFPYNNAEVLTNINNIQVVYSN